MLRYFLCGLSFSFEYGCILSASVKCANVPDCYQWCPNSRNSYMYLGNTPGPLLSGPLIHSLKHIDANNRRNLWSEEIMMMTTTSWWKRGCGRS